MGLLSLTMVLEEALRLECLNIVADLVKQSAQLETTMAKLYTSWKRVGNLSERLFVDTGASTPHLRHLLGCLDKLSSNVIEMRLNDFNNQTIRLQILSDAD